MIRRTPDTAITRNAAALPTVRRAALLFIVVVAAAITVAALRAAALRVVIIGDSTAYTYSAADSLRGWGQELGFFFTPGAVTVTNKSIGGRSSRSFIEDGHWTSTKSILKKGDVLLISFGTNDRGTVAERHADTAQFRRYLTQYVNESRAAGAIPVLLSTVNQNSWSGTTFVRGFATGSNDYRGAMLRVVDALDVPFIDLEQKSADLFKSLGKSYLANFFFIAGDTHFQEMGAVNIAKLVAEGIKELAPDPDVGALAAAVAPQYMVDVTSNKSGAGTITASGTYPRNAPLTLKVMPNPGETFRQWQDESGTSLSTQKLYKFTMGSAACAYTAAFKGGTTSLSRSVTPSAAPRTPAIVLSGTGTVSIESDEAVLEVRIADVSGRTLMCSAPDRRHSTIDIRSFPHGTYVISARTKAGVTRQSLRR